MGVGELEAGDLDHTAEVDVDTGREALVGLASQPVVGHRVAPRVETPGVAVGRGQGLVGAEVEPGGGLHCNYVL